MKVLEDRDDEAVRKYEEAQVTSAKDDQKAERLVREAIATWEEILPQAANAEYPKFAVARLATAFIRLAGVQERLGKRSDAEASLKKAIDYGARAVELDPARPLARHNLEVANRMLDGMHDDVFQEEINKLNRSRRFAAVIERFTEESKNRKSASRRPKALKQPCRARLPAGSIRLVSGSLPRQKSPRHQDGRRPARRATSLRSDMADYWYTLAMVQYRHGDWPGSLASLETLKVKQGEVRRAPIALSAMNLERLNRREEAQAAVGHAVQWMEEKSRKAGGDAFLRMEFELMRPNFEALLREAQSLLNGEPADSGRPA